MGSNRTDKLIQKVLTDLENEPDTSELDFIDTTFYLGIYRMYKLYRSGNISKETGKRLKAQMVKEYELYMSYDEIYQRHIKTIKEATRAGVKLTKLLKNGSPLEEVLDNALEVLNMCDLNGGIPWERSKA